MPTWEKGETPSMWFGWLAKIQLVPAILAASAGIIVFLLLLTLIFGRIYCSVICPLGVFQDVVAWLGKRRKKLPYAYSPAVSWLRYAVLAIFIVALLAGIDAIFTLFEPYSAYGRISSAFFRPVYALGNNILAYFAARWDSYAFYPVSVWWQSGVLLLTAAVTAVVVIILAWRNGRTWCNTVCPAGTVLGFAARFSLFRPRIDLTKCTSCGVCGRRCKAACIDTKHHKIDYSRCVACMDCLEACNQSAMRYTLPLRRKPVAVPETIPSDKTADVSRRTFLAIGATVAITAAVKAQEQKVDGGFITLPAKHNPKRQTPIVPPGAQGLRHLSQHCTACQLCISACPNHVLRSSTDLSRFMQPEMQYDKGYCRPECTRCSEVCPTGAIRRITAAEKTSIQIGNAIWDKDKCLVIKDKIHCNSCERHCPVQAIRLVALDASNPDSPKVPAVDTGRCIGCGACEHVCPARPQSAIRVEGHLMHKTV